MQFQKFTGSFFSPSPHEHLFGELTFKQISQDQDQKEVLTEIIQDLLGDKQTIVLGSAVAAFNEVCPERLDLIHPHYRKLCNLLADIDEWGQISILTLLIRYGRSQFVNPDPDKVSIFVVLLFD